MVSIGNSRLLDIQKNTFTDLDACLKSIIEIEAKSEVSEGKSDFINLKQKYDSLVQKFDSLTQKYDTLVSKSNITPAASINKATRLINKFLNKNLTNFSTVDQLDELINDCETLKKSIQNKDGIDTKIEEIAKLKIKLQNLSVSVKRESQKCSEIYKRTSSELENLHYKVKILQEEYSDKVKKYKAIETLDTENVELKKAYSTLKENYQLITKLFKNLNDSKKSKNIFDINEFARFIVKPFKKSEACPSMQDNRDQEMSAVSQAPVQVSLTPADKSDKPDNSTIQFPPSPRESLVEESTNDFARKTSEKSASEFSQHQLNGQLINIDDQEKPEEDNLSITKNNQFSGNTSNITPKAKEKKSKSVYKSIMKNLRKAGKGKSKKTPEDQSETRDIDGYSDVESVCSSVSNIERPLSQNYILRHTDSNSSALHSEIHSCPSIANIDASLTKKKKEKNFLTRITSSKPSEDKKYLSVPGKKSKLRRAISIIPGMKRKQKDTSHSENPKSIVETPINFTLDASPRFGVSSSKEILDASNKTESFDSRVFVKNPSDFNKSSLKSDQYFTPPSPMEEYSHQFRLELIYLLYHNLTSTVLTFEETCRIADAFNLSLYKQDILLYSQNSSLKYLYILMDGNVTVKYPDGDIILKKNDFIFSDEFLHEIPAPADVVVSSEKLYMFKISRQELTYQVEEAEFRIHKRIRNILNSSLDIKKDDIDFMMENCSIEYILHEEPIVQKGVLGDKIYILLEGEIIKAQMLHAGKCKSESMTFIEDDILGLEAISKTPYTNDVYSAHITGVCIATILLRIQN